MLYPVLTSSPGCCEKPGNKSKEQSLQDRDQLLGCQIGGGEDQRVLGTGTARTQRTRKTQRAKGRKAETSSLHPKIFPPPTEGGPQCFALCQATHAQTCPGNKPCLNPHPHLSPIFTPSPANISYLQLSGPGLLVCIHGREKGCYVDLAGQVKRK